MTLEEFRKRLEGHVKSAPSHLVDKVMHIIERRLSRMPREIPRLDRKTYMNDMLLEAIPFLAQLTREWEAEKHKLDEQKERQQEIRAGVRRRRMRNRRLGVI